MAGDDRNAIIGERVLEQSALCQDLACIHERLRRNKDALAAAVRAIESGKYNNVSASNLERIAQTSQLIEDYKRKFEQVTEGAKALNKLGVTCLNLEYDERSP